MRALRVLVCLIAVQLYPFFASASPLEHLPGLWTGSAQLHFAESKETLKCRSTYFVKGSELKQNIRCASQDYTITLRAVMNVNDDKITGTWEEEKYSISGNVSGQLAPAGMNLTINGPTFKARMSLETTSCKQTVDISSPGSALSRILIRLNKC